MKRLILIEGKRFAILDERCPNEAVLLKNGDKEYFLNVKKFRLASIIELKKSKKNGK
jgi:hypothetical protein